MLSNIETIEWKMFN